MDLDDTGKSSALCSEEGQVHKKHARIFLADGREISIPLKFYPRLQKATESERKNYELFGLNIYWEDLDEGIDLTAMLTGMYRRREHLDTAT